MRFIEFSFAVNRQNNTVMILFQWGTGMWPLAFYNTGAKTDLNGFSGKLMYTIRKISAKLAEVKYIRETLENPVDLSEFRERPTPRLIAGLILMGLSYIIGWPAVAALGILAGWFREPMIAVIGCPTTYGLSYVVFLVGAWLAQAPHYIMLLTRYAVGSLFRKLLNIKIA